MGPTSGCARAFRNLVLVCSRLTAFNRKQYPVCALRWSLRLCRHKTGWHSLPRRSVPSSGMQTSRHMPRNESSYPDLWRPAPSSSTQLGDTRPDACSRTDCHTHFFKRLRRRKQQTRPRHNFEHYQSKLGWNSGITWKTRHRSFQSYPQFISKPAKKAPLMAGRQLPGGTRFAFRPTQPNCPSNA